METYQKIKILSKLTSFEREEELNFESCIYHVSVRSQKVPVLKIMQTTLCDKNCIYCAFRRDRESIPRLFIKPEELAKGFMNLYKEGKVRGLLLSSGIFGNPEFTMEKMIDTVKILREKYQYKGYIHLKIMPGVSLQTVEESVKLADRVSINIETSKEERLKKVAKGKSITQDMLQKIKYIDKLIKNYKGKSQITQMMVGIDDETDEEIIKVVDYLNRNYDMDRIYFSAFFPVKDTPLENKKPESPQRENRLYQVDFLIREYGFSFKEFLPILKNGNLPLEVDPKTAWAEANLQNFPVEINVADYQLLIKIPGIGKKTANEIIKRRKEKKISSPEDLKNIKNLSKILKYVTINGKYFYCKNTQLKLFRD